MLSERRPGLQPQPQPRTGARAYEALHAELSPYTVTARQYRDEVLSAEWLDVRTRAGRTLSRLPGPPAVVAELPVAAFDGAVRSVRKRLGVGRFALTESDAAA